LKNWANATKNRASMAPARDNATMNRTDERLLLSPDQALVSPRSLKKFWKNEYPGVEWSVFVPPG